MDGWKSPGGGMYRAPYGANNDDDDEEEEEEEEDHNEYGKDEDGDGDGDDDDGVDNEGREDLRRGRLEGWGKTNMMMSMMVVEMTATTQIFR